MAQLKKGATVRRCWLVIITKGLRVWMPPEVYLEKTMAAREVKRWVETLSRTRTPADVLGSAPLRLRDQVLLHVIETHFMEPWRACPLWIGIRWSEKSYPRLRAELMAADAPEASAWVGSQARRAMPDPSEADLGFELDVVRRGVRSHVAAHRIKRFIGF